MNRYALAALGLASTLLAILAVVPESSAESEEEYVITAPRLERELPADIVQVGGRVVTITAEEIRNGGYVDVGHALQALAPGIYVSSKNGPFDYVDISLHGSRTQDVLWLVDGIRINNRLYAGTTPLDTLPVSMVDRIEVLEGGQSLFYGTQALAGAVNVVTKEFVDRPEVSLTAGGDTNSGSHVDGNFGGAMRGHQFVLFGSHDQSNGYRPYPSRDFQPSATDRHRSYDVLTFGGKYGFSIANNLRATVSYQHVDATLGFATPQLVAAAYNERSEDLASGKIDYSPVDWCELLAKAYSHWWDSHYTEIHNVIGGPGQLTVINNHDFWGFTDYGANLLAKLRLNRGFEYFVGYDFQNYSGRDEVLLIEQHTEHVHAAFGQIRTTPDLVAKLRLALGTRYNAPTVGHSSVIWNASGRYDLFPQFFVRATAGTAFRLPTAEELFANDPLDERGNPNLKPEESSDQNLAVGGSAAIPVPWNWEIVGFHREIEDRIDLIDFDPETQQDVFGNAPGKVKVWGSEAAIESHPIDGLMGRLSFLYNHAREGDSSKQANRIPAVLFKATADYSPPILPIGGGMSLIYVGDVFDTLGGGIGRVEYGDYPVLDLFLRLFLDSAHRHRITRRCRTSPAMTMRRT